MGKIFSNKNLIIKIATILVIVILFNFINPSISFGGVSGGIGGVLFEPIKDFVLAMGDGIVNIMQNVIFGTDVSLLKLEHNTSNVPTILGAIRRSHSRDNSGCSWCCWCTIYRRTKLRSCGGRT